MQTWKRIFRNGHTYYRTDDARIVVQDSDAGGEVFYLDRDRQIVIAADGINIPLVGGFWTSASPGEVSDVVKHFGMMVSIGGLLFKMAE